jgi:hypothetical protein
MKGPAFRGAAWWTDAGVLGTDTREMRCGDVGGAWVHRATGVAGSPFEPMLRLWELGIVFEEVDDGVLVLDRACRRLNVPSWRAHVPYA